MNKACLLLCLSSLLAVGVSRTGLAQPGPSAAKVSPLLTRYDSNDPDDLRLWRGRAPGATGDDPARDIPFLRAFLASSSDGRPAPAVLIIPGGGYNQLTDTKEQEPVAEYFRQRLHVSAFVLRYRLVQSDGTYRYPVPVWDGQRALRFLRHQAASLGIDPSRIGVFGFSAGGHLAATVTLHPDGDFGLPTHDPVDGEDGRAAWLGLGYAVLSMDPTAVPPSGAYKHLLGGFGGAELQRLQHFLSADQNITRSTPPTFLFESLDDKVIGAQNSVLFVDAMQRAGRPLAAHLFAHGCTGRGCPTASPGKRGGRNCSNAGGRTIIPSPDRRRTSRFGAWVPMKSQAAPKRLTINRGGGRRITQAGVCKLGACNQTSQATTKHFASRNQTRLNFCFTKRSFGCLSSLLPDGCVTNGGFSGRTCLCKMTQGPGIRARPDGKSNSKAERTLTRREPGVYGIPSRGSVQPHRHRTTPK